MKVFCYIEDMSTTHTTTGYHYVDMSDSERSAEAAKLREQAQACRQRSAESFERCDTDGFLSQGANDANALTYEAQANILDNAGMACFPALFDLDGNLVAAKLVDTRYGLAWGILANDDPASEIVAWVTAFPARESTMAKKGYREGDVMAPAWASSRMMGGPEVYRLDGGFSRM